MVMELLEVILMELLVVPTQEVAVAAPVAEAEQEEVALEAVPEAETMGTSQQTQMNGRHLCLM